MAIPLLKTGFIDDGRSGRQLSVLFAIVTVVAMVTLYYQQNAFLEAFEAKSYDLRFKTVRGVRPPADDVVIMAIDDKSIAELGRYPWSRTQYVQLLDHLKDAHTSAVVFDVFFPEPESAAADQALGTAIARAGNVIMAELHQLDR